MSDRFLRVMADDPKAAQKKSLVVTAAKRKAVFRDARYREQENTTPTGGDTLIRRVVDDTLRSILDRRGWLEHTKLEARYHADVIHEAMRTVRNAPNRDFILNLIWAALSLGLSSGHSAEWMKRVTSEGGKKSAIVRAEKSKDWRAYVTERARLIRVKNPTISQHGLAEKITLEWQNKPFERVGHSRLVQFISNLERNGQVPKRKRGSTTK